MKLPSAKIIQDAQQTDNTFRYQALYIALEALSEKVRITMLLHYMQGYQVKEIAEITDATESAVKKQLSRGREELKKRLKDE